jgi:hypothetical protein
MWMRLRDWLGKVGEQLLPDVTEIVTHTVRLGVLIIVEIAIYLCLHLPGVPSHLRESADLILNRAIVMTVVIFCVSSLAVYTINACAAVRERIEQTKIGRTSIVALVSLTCLVGFYGVADRFNLGFGGAARPASFVLSLDQTVTRSAQASMRFVLPSHFESVDLAFFIPECSKCRYLAMLDEGVAAEVVSSDAYGNFKFSCAGSRLISGPHFLQVIEVKPFGLKERDGEPRKYVFAFEVIRR